MYSLTNEQVNDYRAGGGAAGGGNQQVEVVIINQGDEPSFGEELAKDVLEIITVFSARLYGARSHKNRRLIEGMKEAVDNAAGAQD